MKHRAVAANSAYMSVSTSSVPSWRPHTSSEVGDGSCSGRFVLEHALYFARAFQDVQLYVNGELVGGADIVEEMHSKGELKQLLSAT